MRKSHLPNILILIILFIGFFLQGCSTSHDTKYSAKYLDSLVNVNPKKVYFILKQQRDFTHSKEEANRYALYSLLAKDKLYVKHKSDSLPSALVDYYKKQSNKKMVGLSYYMLAATYADLGDVPEAIQTYLKALTSLKGQSPLVYSALINNRLGYEFFKLSMLEQARNHYFKGFDLFSQLADSSRMENLCKLIGSSYSVQNKDSMTFWYKKGYSLAKAMNAKNAINANLSGIATSFIAKYQRDSALYYLNKVDTTNLRRSLIDAHYLHKGEYFYTALHSSPEATTELDSARYYFSKILHCKNLDTRSRAAYYLSILNEMNGDYKTAFELMRKRVAHNDSLHNKKVFEAAHKIKATYNYKLAQKAKEQAEAKALAYRNYLVFTVLLVIALLASTFLAIKWRQQRTETKTYKDFALGNLLEGVRKNFKLLERNNSDRTRTLQEEGLSDFIYNNSELTQSYKLLQEMLEVEDRTIKDSEWRNIVQAVDNTLPKFRKHLDLLALKRSPSQQKYCYLTKLGFKQNEIAQLIPMSESGVSQLKRRLVGKIDSDEVTIKNLTETIQNL